MRLFLAASLPESARSHLSAALCEHADAPRSPQWTPPARWHLTLQFLGEVGPDRMRDLGDRLAVAASASVAISLRLAGAGTFPVRGGPPRVLWIGVAGGAVADIDRLAELAARIGAAATEAGIERERRRFQPHLTVGRWPATGRLAGSGVAGHPIAAALSAYLGPACDVTAMQLIRSHLGPRPRYEVLSSWRLGRPAVPL